ncbi:LysR family transcriptional regulator [Enterobacter ludwigii]|uniref:LysR family transcriptional regulator n=1 Tax=Enterobacter cloacae complex TaxID=354276 RepID=UPI0013691FD0|nr:MULTISPECIES: LysR family transcriptional regulator [Enterobacter cloacae complex]MBQ0309818.1 LysR family transcriptional regulator [Enterobacter ludwigii]MDP5160335.1 LysR family transcriptional regulator [Enterobacter ludwigii]MDV8143065.1 LysR family transcriptional regulator [Enterobacter ludwigii]MXV03803.1 LysR family transcriptional regulator [Enterobacter sp. ABFQC]WNI99486.1 LysR family transcriptional regulator [Enterobacter ludwigii]
MINLQRTAMFVAVADTGSFTAAAEAMGLTKAVVSFNIRQLEDELGVTLLLRSTRRLTLTEAGRLFHQRSVALLKDAERLKDDVRANHAGLTGELRITTTPEYGSQVVVPLLAEFSQQHPDLRVRHVSSSLHADLISERFDVAIRLGTLADSRYHAALITQFTIFPVATPGWLRNHPVESLEQLAKADWIIHERLASPLRWQVNDAFGEPATLEIKKAPRLFADSAQALMAFALAGCGVALLPEWLVRHALDDGKLVSVLPEYTFARQGIYAVYPDAPHVPAKVRTFIDFMRTRVN